MALKAAVIGLGRMGAEPSIRLEDKIPGGWLPISHAEAIVTTPGLELTAICDQNEELLKRHKQYYGVKQAYTSYQQMIDETRPDIVSIATRTDVRCDIIAYALQKGVKGFYAEKPMSRSLKDCKEVLKKVDSFKAKIVYGATRRAMDIYKKAKQICWSGEIGAVKQITIEFGSSALLWSHPHSVDLITFFASSAEMTHVQGYCSIEDDSVKSSLLIDQDPIVHNGYFRFANGISATITQTEGINVRIACSKGNLTIHGDGYCIEINRLKNIPGYFHTIEELHVDSAKSGTQYLMEDLRDAVLFQKPVKNITHEEILCGQQLLFGIVESTLQNGKIINLDDIRDGLVVTGRMGGFYA